MSWPKRARGTLEGDIGGDGSLQAELEIWSVQTFVPGRVDGDRIEVATEQWYSTADLQADLVVTVEAEPLAPE